MSTTPPNKPPKSFVCDLCDFKCSSRGDWNKHIVRPKHTNQQIATIKTQEPSPAYVCNCGKSYKERTGLWRHKKICNSNNTNINNTNVDKELIMMIMKENNELKNMVLEQSNIILKVIENGTHNTTNNNNSHNKSFNLNFFLNETCKDAMNIMDFVDSIKLQLSDLERVGEVGYIEGISNIIVKNLKNLDVTLRPVHCTDKKRETIYIKDEDKWSKDENKATMHKVVKKVTTKNQRLIQQFKEVHPDYGKYSSKFSDQYNKIIVESMGGAGDNDFEKEEKIIAKVSKVITIEKDPSSL